MTFDCFYLDESALVEQITGSLERWISVSNVRLGDTQHVECSLVELHECGVVDLTQTKELQDLLHFRGNFVDTEIQDPNIRSHNLENCFGFDCKIRSFVVTSDGQSHYLMKWYLPTDADDESNLWSFWNVDVSSFLCFACLVDDRTVQLQVRSRVTLSADQVLTFAQCNLRLKNAFTQQQSCSSCQATFSILQFGLGNCWQFFVLCSSCCWLGCWFSSWSHPKTTKFKILKACSLIVNNLKIEFIGNRTFTFLRRIKKEAEMEFRCVFDAMKTRQVLGPQQMKR